MISCEEFRCFIQMTEEEIEKVPNGVAQNVFDHGRYCQSCLEWAQANGLAEQPAPASTTK